MLSSLTCLPAQIVLNRQVSIAFGRSAHIICTDHLNSLGTQLAWELLETQLCVSSNAAGRFTDGEKHTSAARSIAGTACIFVRKVFPLAWPLHERHRPCALFIQQPCQLTKDLSWLGIRTQDQCLYTKAAALPSASQEITRYSASICLELSAFAVRSTSIFVSSDGIQRPLSDHRPNFSAGKLAF